MFEKTKTKTNTNTKKRKIFTKFNKTKRNKLPPLNKLPLKWEKPQVANSKKSYRAHGEQPLPDPEWLKNIFTIPTHEYKVKKIDLGETELSDANNWGWLQFPIVPKDMVERVTKWEDLYDSNTTLKSIEDKSILTPSKKSTNRNTKKKSYGGAHGEQPLPNPGDILRFSHELANNLLPNNCCLFFYTKDAANNITSTEWFFVYPNQIEMINKKEIIGYATATTAIPLIMNNLATLPVPLTIYFRVNIPECANKLFAADPQTVFQAGYIYIFQNQNNYERRFLIDETANSIRYNINDMSSVKKYTQYWDGYIIGFQRCNRDLQTFYNDQFGPNLNGMYFTPQKLDRMSNHTGGHNDYPNGLQINDRLNWVLNHIPVLEQEIRNVFNRKAPLHIVGTPLPFQIHPNLGPNILYRGMSTPYLSTNGIPLQVGESIIINQFTSTSRDRTTAQGFANTGTNPHLYILTIDSGVPYINLNNNQNWTVNHC